MEDIARRREDLEAELASIGRKVSVEDIADLVSRITVSPESAPDWWEANFAPARAGTITPADADWESLVGGLRHEVRGEAPDQDPSELSEWARTWARHLVETLGLSVVVELDGTIQATTTDPREEGQRRKVLSPLVGSTLGRSLVERKNVAAVSGDSALPR